MRNSKGKTNHIKDFYNSFKAVFSAKHNQCNTVTFHLCLTLKNNKNIIIYWIAMYLYFLPENILLHWLCVVYIGWFRILAVIQILHSRIIITVISLSTELMLENQEIQITVSTLHQSINIWLIIFSVFVDTNSIIDCVRSTMYIKLSWNIIVNNVDCVKLLKILMHTVSMFQYYW